MEYGRRDNAIPASLKASSLLRSQFSSSATSSASSASSAFVHMSSPPDATRNRNPVAVFRRTRPQSAYTSRDSTNSSGMATGPLSLGWEPRVHKPANSRCSVSDTASRLAPFRRSRGGATTPPPASSSRRRSDNTNTNTCTRTRTSAMQMSPWILPSPMNAHGRGNGGEATRQSSDEGMMGGGTSSAYTTAATTTLDGEEVASTSIPSPLMAPPKRGRGSGGRVFIGTMHSVPSAGSGGRSYFGMTPKTTQHAEEERLVAGGVHERNRGDVYEAGRNSIIREKDHHSTERRKTTNGKHEFAKAVCLRVIHRPSRFAHPPAHHNHRSHFVAWVKSHGRANAQSYGTCHTVLWNRRGVVGEVVGRVVVCRVVGVNVIGT